MSIQEEEKDLLVIHADEEEDNNEMPPLCTFAATGPRLLFQAIYNCRTCMEASDFSGGEGKDQEDEALGLCCICESCADYCHGDHEVEFLGYAPAYCDCSSSSKVKCKIIDESNIIAAEYGVPKGGKDVECSLVPNMCVSKKECGACTGHDPFGFTVKSYQYSDDFTESTLCQELLRQAQILSSFNDNRIKNQSNKTYWVGGENNNELFECKENLIMLESFALAIFERHVKTFGLELTPESGAEWWVQVKHSEAVDTLFDANDNIVPQHKPIDLHYDKDEAMAANFGLGYFPTLSTVTYLSSTITANPTIIIPQTYHDAQDKLINQIIFSRPERGKHIVFDGRLLHGAPSLVLDAPRHESSDVNDLIDYNLKPRVTFLVNIWMNGKPLDATCLTDEERKRFTKDINYQSKHIDSSVYMKLTENEIYEHEVKDRETLGNEEDRILLPFVSTNAEWIDEESESDVQLSLIPPPSSCVESTFRIKYEDTSQARFVGIEEGSFDESTINS